MKLFQTDGSTLQPIERDSFKLEKDIQALIESNTQELFDLTFISSEFAVREFRLDSLAFDEESKAFVIIEYKRGRSSSVVDQGYTYLSVMLNNKADFILEYNEKMDKSLKRSDIDWSSSRVIFVAEAFTPYQKNSVNFSDIPFELWEIKKFAGGMVTFEQHLAASSESINELANKGSNSVISKVSSEVKVSTEKELVAKLNETVKPIWQELRERLSEYPDTSFNVKGDYISWRRDGKVACYITFKPDHLLIHFQRAKADGTLYADWHDPKGLIENPEDHKAYPRLCLSNEADLDAVMLLVQQKYNAMA